MFALCATGVQSIRSGSCICLILLVLFCACDQVSDSATRNATEGQDTDFAKSEESKLTTVASSATESTPHKDATQQTTDTADPPAPAAPLTFEQDPSDEPTKPVLPAEEEKPPNPAIASSNQPDLPVDPTWKPLTEKGVIWIDLKQKSVIVSGKVCLRAGQLEMFACTPNTKEYESLVVVNCPAFMVHTALLAVGAKAGSPVSFSPYKAASGSVVDVFVEWFNDEGVKQRVKAQEWIRHETTGKPMPHDFVFGGSSFWTDDDGTQKYSAAGGELICVSNFSTAMMDLPVASPQSNQGLWFSTFTERIPKLETRVHLILTPRPQ